MLRSKSYFDDPTLAKDMQALVDKYKHRERRVDFKIDWGFIVLLPALSINFHSSEIEFEWLIFGIYLKCKQL